LTDADEIARLTALSQVLGERLESRSKEIELLRDWVSRCKNQYDHSQLVIERLNGRIAELETALEALEKI
jgi:predicted  nucleic acid-binding Zn-ribbon protein